MAVMAVASRSRTVSMASHPASHTSPTQQPSTQPNNKKADKPTMATPTKTPTKTTPTKTPTKTTTTKTTQRVAKPGGGANKSGIPTEVLEILAQERTQPTPQEKARLERLIPAQWFADEYIHREIDGAPDVDLLSYARATKENVLLFGPTGSGKTGLVYAYAAANKIPLVNVACNGALDPATLFARPTLIDGNTGYIESDVTLILRFGGILYLDEINFTPMRVNAIWHATLDSRRMITIPELDYSTFSASDDLQVIATYNPGYEDTKPLNKALRNRFSIPQEWDYDRTVEGELIVSIPSLLEFAHRLRARIDAGDVETPLGTNKLREFEDHALDWAATHGTENGYSFAANRLLFGFESHERAAVAESLNNFKDRIVAEIEMIRIEDAKENNK